MKKLLFVLIVLTASVWVGLQIKSDPGYILVAFHQWTIETPIWFGILFLVILYLTLHYIWRFIRGTGALAGRFDVWNKRRHVRRARSRTSRGLIELAEGHWDSAEKYLLRAASRSNTPMINYLAAARAAQQLGDFERRDEHLRKAHESTKGAEIAVGLTQAELQLERNQLEQSLATLQHLKNLVPNHSYVLLLLKKVYIKLNDWQNLLALLPSLKRQKVIDKEQFLQLETNAHIALLKQSETHWQDIPNKLKNQMTLISLYINLLFERKQFQTAQSVIEQTLPKNWDNKLVDVYGLLESDNSEKQFNTAEGWLKSEPNNPALMLCLARLAQRNRLFTKAREYAENSLALDTRPETYALLGDILMDADETNRALENYRQGLNLSINSNVSECIFSGNNPKTKKSS